jgi:hypothetical protein
MFLSSQNRRQRRGLNGIQRWWSGTMDDATGEDEAVADDEERGVEEQCAAESEEAEADLARENMSNVFHFCPGQNGQCPLGMEDVSALTDPR